MVRSSRFKPGGTRDAVRIGADAKLGVRPNAWMFAGFDDEFSTRGPRQAPWRRPKAHYLAAVNCFASRISARSLSALRVSRARLLK